MILSLESNRVTRKKLCDLLNKERIIGIDSVQQAIEMICKYKNEIRVLIANVHFLCELFSTETIFRLGQKLSIKTPPILGFSSKEDEKIKTKLERENKQCRFIEYNEKDPDFPARYIHIIKGFYHEVVADIERANETWLKETETDDLIDTRKWLNEEGFLKATEKERSEKDGKPQDATVHEGEKDYRKLYFELKKEHDELLKTVKELMDSIDKNQS
ncbi:MAG: hypothetical protein WBB67_12675 [bacterium]